MCRRLNWFRCLWWKVGIRGRRAGGVVPVVTVDSGTEEEEISASCRSVSMPEERVGMVSREAEVERGMADGRVVAAAVDVSDLAGRSNPVQEIECDPNSAGGLVVTQN
ncbi:hypothetical protein V6N11_051862 [Hibiscus sabdariffa]|uniref:Uncharacterized protein n=1 Tax=Hibiscus sabdariffa TaxID=183260 RepID=A0ABR2U8L6_9ROSI